MFPPAFQKPPTGGLTSGDTTKCGLTILRSWLGVLCQRLCEAISTFTPTRCIQSSSRRVRSIPLRFHHSTFSLCPRPSRGSAATLSVGVVAAAMSARHSPAITGRSRCRRIATAWLTTPTPPFVLRQSSRLAVANLDPTMLSKSGERSMPANPAVAPPPCRAVGRFGRCISDSCSRPGVSDSTR